MTSLSLTAIVLTYNEEMHIDRCLGSLRESVQRIVVVDSNSSDATVELARRAGADIYQRSFRNHADQFNWALDHCGIASDWVLRIDADEYVDAELMREMGKRLPQMDRDVAGVVVNRLIKFFGRPIRYGGVSPHSVLRVWRSGKGRVENRWMDEHVILSGGRIASFSGFLVDENLKDMSFWVDKHNQYATREMVDFLNSQHHFFVEGDLSGTAGEARLKRRAKTSLYNRAPLLHRAFLFFLYRYVFRLGFLDGTAGFLFHFMQGFWYRLLIDMKIVEARTYIQRNGVEAFKQMLRDRHKLSL